MKRLRSPANRPNDGHVYQMGQVSPLSSTLRKVADLVLHERAPKDKPAYSRSRGKEHFASRRFTEAEVIAMRKRHQAGERICDMAREFKLRPRHMARILNGEQYAWVRDDLVPA